MVGKNEVYSAHICIDKHSSFLLVRLMSSGKTGFVLTWFTYSLLELVGTGDC